MLKSLRIAIVAICVVNASAATFQNPTQHSGNPRMVPFVYIGGGNVPRESPAPPYQGALLPFSYLTFTSPGEELIALEPSVTAVDGGFQQLSAHVNFKHALDGLMFRAKAATPGQIQVWATSYPGGHYSQLTFYSSVYDIQEAMDFSFQVEWWAAISLFGVTSNVDLTEVTQVRGIFAPEPGTWAIVAFALAAGLCLRWRHQHFSAR